MSHRHACTAYSRRSMPYVQRLGKACSVCIGVGVHDFWPSKHPCAVGVQDDELAGEARAWQATIHAAYGRWAAAPGFTAEAGPCSLRDWLAAIAAVESRAFGFKVRPHRHRHPHLDLPSLQLLCAACRLRASHGLVSALLLLALLPARKACRAGRPSQQVEAPACAEVRSTLCPTSIFLASAAPPVFCRVCRAQGPGGIKVRAYVPFWCLANHKPHAPTYHIVANHLQQQVGGCDSSCSLDDVSGDFQMWATRLEAVPAGEQQLFINYGDKDNRQVRRVLCLPHGVGTPCMCRAVPVRMRAR